MPGNRALDRALGVLVAVCESGEDVALGELSKKVDLPKSTTRRILQGLGGYRFVAQDPQTRLYRPGPGLLALAFHVFDRMDVRNQSLPELKELNRTLNETIHLAILDEGEVVYIDKFETDRPMRMYSAIGRRAPVHCTAIGKALLADLPDEEVDLIVRRRGMTRYTPTTITTLPDLRQHLRMVAERGYATDNAEHELEIRCIAAPVRDYAGRTTAAVSITVPSVRATMEDLEALAPLLCATAGAISHKMGSNHGAKAGPWLVRRPS
jgi:IclR family KDG regulon transcriptional repressor